MFPAFRSLRPLKSRIGQRRTFFIGALIIIGVAAGSAGFFAYSASQETSVLQHPPRTPGGEALTYWEAYIDTNGPDAAYQYFQESYANLPPGTQHLLAHVMGTALYQQEGVAGFSVCDSTFVYGCYHAFVGMTIREKGTSVVTELNENCYTLSSEQSALLCQHGIGHGILTELGYARENLETALRICESLKYGDELGGCFSGIFMEYNQRTMQQMGSADSRGTDRHSLMSPCSDIPHAYRAACYYRQPWWWTSLAIPENAGLAKRFSWLGDLCRSVRAGPEQDACFRGIGNVIDNAVGYDARLAVQACKAASTNMRQQLLCRIDAANTYALDEYPNEARGVCAGLASSTKRYCLGYATNTYNKTNEPPLPSAIPHQ